MTFDIGASGCGERFVPLLTRELKKAKVVNGWAVQRWPEAFVGAKIAVTGRASRSTKAQAKRRGPLSQCENAFHLEFSHGPAQEG